ncbi:MAG: type 4a pilus biogenesis protein PilO [bacterium]
MAILPTNKRDQVLGLVGFVAVALAVVFYLYVWDPKRIELNESQARIDSLTFINQRAKAELAQGKTNQLKEEAERYAADLDVMRKLVPTGNEVPLLLDQVSTAARRVGLDLADVQPLPSLQGDQYDAYKYRLSMRGNFHQIAVLLANIGSLQRIVAPINLTLAPIAADPRAPKRDRSQQLEARFEIQTYVARTVAPPPAPTIKAKSGPDAAKPGEK